MVCFDCWLVSVGNLSPGFHTRFGNKTMQLKRCCKGSCVEPNPGSGPPVKNICKFREKGNLKVFVCGLNLRKVRTLSSNRLNPTKILTRHAGVLGGDSMVNVRWWRFGACELNQNMPMTFLASGLVEQALLFTHKLIEAHLRLEQSPSHRTHCGRPQSRHRLRPLPL